MAEMHTKENPRFGNYRIELRDSKGRYTSRYSLARSFKIVLGDKVIQNTVRFPTNLRLARDKKSYVQDVIGHYSQTSLRQKKKRAAEEKRAAKGRPSRKKPVSDKRRTEREVPPADSRIPKRREPTTIETLEEEEFENRVERLKEIMEDIERFPGQASKIILTMGASSKGIYVEPLKKWDKKKGKYITDRGDVFERLRQRKIKNNNMIWSIARNYLRQLGPNYFKQLARLSSRKTLHFRLFLVTNLPEHPDIVKSPAKTTSLFFDVGAKPREMLDRMTFLLVNSIMKSLYAGGHYQDGKLTSSEAYFVTKSQSQQSTGTRSTRTQNFKLAFTMLLETE